MVIRTKAEEVRENVRPVMRAAEGPDVSSLGVECSGALNRKAADLAGIVVHSLYLKAKGRVTHDAKHRRRASTSRARRYLAPHRR